MKNAVAKQDYEVIEQDLISNDDSFEFCVMQRKNDELEIWKEREDGFLFVYSKRLEIGYWVHPQNLKDTK